jgi:hypothetical protein
VYRRGWLSKPGVCIHRVLRACSGGLHIGQRCRRWMSFFQNGQLCFSTSCCHLGPNTFFWISGLLIPIDQLQSGADSKTYVTFGKRSTVILCGRERECCKRESVKVCSEGIDECNRDFSTTIRVRPTDPGRGLKEDQTFTCSLVLPCHTGAESDERRFGRA